MPRDASDTKRRLLDAAYHEFAEHGLAGARVDRITDAAKANPRSLYLHFTNKETLFDTVVTYSIQQLADLVPFTPEDLPGYAGRLFDHLVEHPEHLRLSIWAQLERPVSTPEERAAYQAKIDALTAAHPASTTKIADILALTLGLITAWLTASPALRDVTATDPFAPQRLAGHRAALTTAVHALLTAHNATTSTLGGS